MSNIDWKIKIYIKVEKKVSRSCVSLNLNVFKKSFIALLKVCSSILGTHIHLFYVSLGDIHKIVEINCSLLLAYF